MENPESSAAIYQESLDYHEKNRPGKIEVTPTKACLTARDLALAYTPGVAGPCREIARDESLAYRYTSKGNLVAVITNGSAVLGLGNIGPLASKPVMEGKGVLFKRFADIDVFDIEVKQNTVEGMVALIEGIAPTFGGINLEDIKAPECFEIERQLTKRVDIPVFHDDQHGTAIIALAGFMNALEVAGRRPGSVRVVFGGAGAAALACAKLFVDFGIKKEHITLCDSKGVVYKGRTEGMNPYKEEFALETSHRTLEEAMKRAHAFIGCSVKGAVTQKMVKSMARNPIIFAMANPDPEIHPREVFQIRKDAIMATGRSDLPNQINNVLGFPFIFRGALDVRATTINGQMKMAAAHALALLAKEDVTDEVKMAYGNREFSFGRNYLIPKPFDSRTLPRVSSAVAKAAMESGVARVHIPNLKEYQSNLSNRLKTSASLMKSLRDRLQAHVEKKQKKVRVAFTSGADIRTVNALKEILRENMIEPVLIGDPRIIQEKLRPHFLEVISPTQDPHFEEYQRAFYEHRQREGIGLDHARALMSEEDYFANMMLKHGRVDAVISGPNLNYPECFRPAMHIIGTQEGKRAAGIFILVFKERALFFADCTTQIRPSVEDLAEIAESTDHLYRTLMRAPPRLAFLSFSTFGSSKAPETLKIKKAVELTKQRNPQMIVDGEIQADVAVNDRLLHKFFDFSSLSGRADVLIFPELSSANISYKLLQQLSPCTAIGPILVPLKKTINIIQRTATIAEIVHMATVTALMAMEEGESS